jgi:hypothetical protein
VSWNPKGRVFEVVGSVHRLNKNGVAFVCVAVEAVKISSFLKWHFEDLFDVPTSCRAMNGFCMFGVSLSSSRRSTFLAVLIHSQRQLIDQTKNFQDKNGSIETLFSTKNGFI